VYRVVWQSFVILLISLLLCVGVELCLRLLHTARADSFPIRFHSRYIHSLNPNTTFEFQRRAINGGETIRTKINEWSFSGEPVDQTGTATRIMVYGDSNIHAAFTEERRTFSRMLEMELEKASKHSFDVINAGVVGYGMDQVLLRIEDEIPIWRPALVIVNIFADNDFGDPVRNRLFFLDEETGDLVHTGVPISETLGNFAAGLYTVRALLRLWQSMTAPTDERRPHRPYVPPPPDVELTKFRQHLEAEREAYRDPARPRAGSDHYDLDVALNPNEKTSRLKVKLMEKLLERIIQVVSVRNEIPLIFLIQPSVKDISTNSTLNYRQLRTLSEHYRREGLTGILEEMLKRLNADYINFFGIFVTDDRSPYYFLADDNHWNDQGQALAARTVARRLLGTGLVN